MYHDYDVTYETSINEFIVPMIIGGVILFIIFIISLIALMRIFKKANRSGIYALIPIYNMIVLLEIINMSTWQVILLFIPGINFVLYAIMMYKVAKAFRKTNGFALGCVFLPFIFLPILAFSDSEYMGINKEAMLGASVVTEVPNDFDENQEKTTTKTETSKLDISIGGGVYQKDYENSLLNLDNNVTDIQKPQLSEEEKKEHIASLLKVETKKDEEDNYSTIAGFKIDTQEEKPPVVEEKEKTGVDLFNEINFVDVGSDNNVVEAVKNDEPASTTVEVIPTIVTNNVETNENNSEDSDFVKCKNCGAMIKKDAARCFMCGKEQ